MKLSHPVPEVGDSVHPAARLGRPGRAAAAATLVLGAGAQAAAFLVAPDQGDTADWLAWVAAHSERAEVSKLLDVLAMPFLLGGVLVFVLLGRLRSPRLAWGGGAVFAAGLTGLTFLQGWEVLAYSLAAQGVVQPIPLAEAVDGLSSPSAVAVFALFFGGVVLGLPLTAVSLWRSGAVPRGAVVLMVLFLAVDFLGRSVEAHVIEFVGWAWVAVTILRQRPIAQPGGAARLQRQPGALPGGDPDRAGHAPGATAVG